MKHASLRLVPLLSLGTILAVGATHLGCGGDSANTGGGGSKASTSDTGGSGPTTTSTGGAGGSGGSAATTGGGGQASGGGGAGMGPFGTPNGTWTQVPVTGAQCMDNSAASIGVNTTSSSDDVIIYLEGGNACFNDATCNVLVANPHGYSSAQFAKDAMGLAVEPIFQRTPTSILKDYNFVYVPYCTGDVHSGNAQAMLGGEMRYFHGAQNMDLILAKVAAAYPNAKNVILSGSSAGGFGAAFNYDRAAKAFPNVKVALIDDSGPPMGVNFVPSCLQQYFIDTWGLASTLPSDCANGCLTVDAAHAPGTNNVFMEPLVAYISGKYTDRRLSIISSSEDGTISKFWGYGGVDPTMPDCSTIDPTGGVGTGAPVNNYPGPTYALGLEDLRDRIIGNEPNFKMYLIDGPLTIDGAMYDDTTHVWLRFDPTQVTNAGPPQTTLATWLTQMLSGDAAWANVPTTGE